MRSVSRSAIPLRRHTPRVATMWIVPKRGSKPFRPEILHLEPICAVSALSIGQGFDQQSVLMDATHASQLAPPDGARSASPAMIAATAPRMGVSRGFPTPPTMISPASRAKAGPPLAASASSPAGILYIPADNSIAISDGGPTSRLNGSGAQPTRTYGGAGTLPSDQAAPPQTPGDGESVAGGGAGVIRPMTISPANPATSQHRGSQGPGGHSPSVTNHGGSTGHATSTPGIAQANGTSGGYYGTGGGYYSSTTTFPSSYSSIDPPSFTQSGSYSGYVGSLPASTDPGNTGSSY